jgi:hypothetical protein
LAAVSSVLLPISAYNNSFGILKLSYIFGDFFNYFWLMVFNATFNNISIYRGGQFYWWKKPEYPE